MQVTKTTAKTTLRQALRVIWADVQLMAGSACGAVHGGQSGR